MIVSDNAQPQPFQIFEAAAEKDPSSYFPPPDPQGSPSSFLSSSGPPIPEVYTDEEDATSVCSLRVEQQSQVVIAKMKLAHLSLNGSLFGEEIPEDIAYEIYKLGTFIQALKPKQPEIDSRW